ncbi:MAG: sulfatase-like hydrolase/transferase [Planctomycetes bacterium]|nr:sulfatase-like hydrolase/transferase [Planctomycetota bacterium]
MRSLVAFGFPSPGAPSNLEPGAAARGASLARQAGRRRRSTTIRITTFAFALAVILLTGVAVVEFGIGERETSPPHIVLIVLDTVRADHVSVAGMSRRETTPFLAALARQGVVFSQARAPANWTLPSHASLFTGLSPSEHGCHFEHRYLAGEAATIAEVLSGSGYATGAFSANVNVSRSFHLDQGFDHFYETWNDAAVRSGQQPGAAIRERLLEWIDSGRKGRPAFVFVNLMDAHLPYDAARGYERFFGEAGESLDRDVLAAPDFLDRVLAGEVPLDAAFRAALAERYDSAIRGLDAWLADVHDALKRRGFLENAVFIVTSDHGENLGDHGLVDHQGSLHESVLRVPLVLWGSGVPAGERHDHPVVLTDLFRWIQDLRDRTFRPDLTASRLALLSERMRPVEVLERLASLRPQVDASALARRGVAAVLPGLPWKLLRMEGLEDGLFALQADSLDEGADVAQAEPGPLARLQGALEQRLRERRSVQEVHRPEEPSVGPSAEELEELTRLGYLSGGRARGGSVHAQEHLARGNRAFVAGDLEAARADFLAASRLDPQFADALFNLALTTDRLDPGAARAAWERYVDAALRAGGQDDASIQHAYRRLQELKHADAAGGEGR